MFEQYVEILEKVVLFRNIAVSDLTHLVSCLGGYIRHYQEGEIIFSAGDRVQHLGVVLAGEVNIVKESIAGDRSIVAVVGQAQMIGDGVAASKKQMSYVTAQTKESATILYIPYAKISECCSNSCGFHLQLIRNMLAVLGEANYQLNNKIDYLLLKGMREKIAHYLLKQMQEENSASFNIPFNRNEMAEYLNVSRSSMCRELGRMKEEGMIDYYKNSFKILDSEKLGQNI